jgi:hypothetical protein
VSDRFDISIPLQGALEARNSVIEYLELEKVQSLTVKQGEAAIQVIHIYIYMYTYIHTYIHT